MYIIEADYQPHPDNNLNDNPLTEALSVHLNRNTFLDGITVKPKIQSNFWSLPPFYQMTQLRQLTDAHLPLPQTWSMYNKLLGLMIYSYVKRHPLSRDTELLKARVAEQLREGKFPVGIPVGMTTAPTVLVSGDSGTGKTTTIRTVLRQIPQVIRHTSYKGQHFRNMQLTWISFDLPPNGAPKAMANNFFIAVDQAMGTSYAAEWGARHKESVDKHLSGMQQVALEHHLGLVHVDELQFMLAYAKNANSPSLQILESLFNKLGIPIVQSSTEAGVALFDTLDTGDHRIGSDITTVRRMLNDRAFKFSNHKLESDYFQQLFNSLYPQSLIVKSEGEDQAALLEKFKARFHQLSCGLPAIMIRLALLHHETLVTLLGKSEDEQKGYHTYQVGLLNRVYKNQFGLIDPALAQYRSGNKTEYESSIRTDTHKSVYSNKELQKEQKKCPKNQAQLVKNEMPQDQNLMLGLDTNPLDPVFLTGFEESNNV